MLYIINIQTGKRVLASHAQAKKLVAAGTHEYPNYQTRMMTAG